MGITSYRNVREGILYEIRCVVTSFFMNYLPANGNSRTIKKGPPDRD